MSSSPSTFTPLSLLSLPSKQDLLTAFKGKNVNELRTPALIVDRKIFKENCERVTLETYKRGMKFRAHMKTHKTTEGTRMQVEAAGGVGSVICSTMPEVLHVVNSGLVEEGLINDILYSMPVSADKVLDLDDAQKKVGTKAIVRLMVDHPAQIEALAKYNQQNGRKDNWSVFVKVDGGGRRAGVPPKSEQMKKLIQSILSHADFVQIHGFYSHFGQSYASSTLDKASEYYQGEITCVNTAAQLARELGAQGDWVLSVGATPTAHAATQGSALNEGLEGKLELHAGCYCMCDLQQFATSLVPPSHLALTVLARVVSLYPHRSEAMCDAGALAVSKDTGPLAGYGHVVSPAHATGWSLGRISQEHGTLVHRQDVEKVEELTVGDLVRIVPQHACLVCAGHPWLYVVEEGGEEVVDVWVPWKGW